VQDKADAIRENLDKFGLADEGALRVVLGDGATLEDEGGGFDVVRLWRLAGMIMGMGMVMLIMIMVRSSGRMMILMVMRVVLGDGATLEDEGGGFDVMRWYKAASMMIRMRRGRGEEADDDHDLGEEERQDDDIDGDEGGGGRWRHPGG
jgi:hypothetical protein